MDPALNPAGRMPAPKGDTRTMADLQAENHILRMGLADIAHFVRKEPKSQGIAEEALRQADPSRSLAQRPVAAHRPSGECVTHHHACDCREALFARAVEIADEAMTELLCAHAKRADEQGAMWALCDADGGDVATLAEADPPAVEAVEWLQRRGLCEVVEHPNGASVLLLDFGD